MYCILFVRLFFKACPVNMLDAIHVQSRSAMKSWSEAGPLILAPQLASGPDMSGQNLTGSARTKADPGWFCTIWSKLSVEECIWVWKWETGSRPVAFCQKWAQWVLHMGLLPDQIGLAKAWQKPASVVILSLFLWKNRTKSDAGSWIRHIIMIRPNSGCMLVVMAVTGRNQNASRSDLACLLCGYVNHTACVVILSLLFNQCYTAWLSCVHMSVSGLSVTLSVSNYVRTFMSASMWDHWLLGKLIV